MRCNNLQKGKIWMPTFSIIVPVYKTEKYLRKCIDSILKQNYEDFELILVDDGSPDQCPNICDKYKRQDTRIKVLHKKNGGVSLARNAGLNMATGRYIWFIDSDDYIAPTALHELYEAQRSEEADLYVFNTFLNQSISLENINCFFEQYYFKYFLGFGPCNKLYKRDIILDSGLEFDKQETIGEDLLFNIQYYKTLFVGGKVKFSFSDKEYYTYVKRDDSAMNTLSKKRIYQQLRLFLKIRKACQELLSDKNIVYLFFMHLISGIGQARQGGMTSKEFAEIDFSDYTEINEFKKIKKDFFGNERASIAGRMRIQLFVWLMKNKKYKLAGKVMGLK